MWSRAQQHRLALERQILAQELPQFYFYNMTGDTYIEGWQNTASGGKNYQLKLVLGCHYPDEMPKLYVTYPHTLITNEIWVTLNEKGTSHFFHTLSNGPSGCVQICHTKTELWNSTMTCVAVLMKGIIWLEAYEAHLRTGRDLCEFCVS